MNCCSQPFGVLRTIVCLALIGVAVTVLTGPVVAIAGFLLPFAVVGALAWGGYRFGQTLLNRVSARQKQLIIVKAKPDPRPATPPSPAVIRPVMNALPVVRPPSRLRRLVRSASYVLVEVGCGAVLGAAMAVIVDWQAAAQIEHAALGAAIGAVVGFVVGGSRPVPARQDGDGNGKIASRAA